MQDPAAEIEAIAQQSVKGSIKDRVATFDEYFAADAELDNPVIKVVAKRRIFDVCQLWHMLNKSIDVTFTRIVAPAFKNKQSATIALDVDQKIKLSVPIMKRFGEYELTIPLTLKMIVFLDFVFLPKKGGRARGFYIKRQKDHILFRETLLASIPFARSLIPSRLIGLFVVNLMRANRFAWNFLLLIPGVKSIKLGMLQDLQELDTNLINKWAKET